MAVPTNVIFGGVPNRIVNASVAAAQAVGFPEQNVQTTDLSEVWRAPTCAPDDNWFQATFEKGASAYAIQCAGVVGANLKRDGLWRVRGDATTQPEDLWETLVPTGQPGYTGSVTAHGGGAPVYTEVDEGCDNATGTDYTKWTGAGTIRWSFGRAAASDEDTSSYRTHAFRIVARAASSAINSDCTVELYDSGGTDVIGKFRPQTTTNTEWCFYWSGSWMGSMANVEIQITGVSGLWVDAVDWVCYTTPTESLELDSGILEAFDSFSTAQALGDPAFASLEGGINWTQTYVHATEQDCQYLHFDFWNPDPFPIVTGWYTDEASPPLEVGHLVAGGLYSPTYNMEYGWSLGVEDSGTVIETDGGGTFYEPQRRKRVAELSLAENDPEELLVNIMLWLDLNLGKGAGFLFIPESGRTGVQTLQNFFARLSDVGRFYTPYYEAMKRSMRLIEW